MNNQHQRDDDGVFHYESGVPVLNTRLDNLESEARAAKRRDEAYKKTQNELNRLLVWFTGVLAFVGAIGGGVSFYQVHVASISASAAQRMASEMTRQYAELQKSANAARDAANISDQTLQQMQASGVDAHNLSVAGSRAWIAPIAASLTEKPTLGHPVKAQIAYENPGRTPALNSHGKWLIEAVDTTKLTTNESTNAHVESSIHMLCGIKPTIGAQVIYPSQTGRQGYVLDMQTVGQFVGNKVIDGTDVIFVEACFAYETMGEVHHAAFCYYYWAKSTPDFSQLSICSIGNHAD